MPWSEFQVLFCRHVHCQPSAYVETAFRKCLYWHARILAPLVRRLAPEFFAEDIKFITYLGACTGLREITADLQTFRDVNLGRRNFWRTGLRIRVSGRKAGRLAERLMAQERKTAATAKTDVLAEG